MSILIKGMEIPKDGTYICVIAEKTMWLFDSVTKIRQGEIYEVPTPHGRLIDADKLDDVCFELNNRTEEKWEITRNDYNRIDNVLFEFPTVIESED